MGACQATLVQPRPYSSPGVPALLPARRASPSGGREARDKGVTYYSVDLGRAQHGGRDNDADRDVTVIAVIPGRRRAPGAMPWRRSPPAGPARAAKGSGSGDGVAPGRRHARSPVPVAHGASSSLSGRCRRPGHQFQLRTAVPLGRRDFSRCPSSPVPVAHCRSFLVAGLSDVAAVTGPAVLPFAFARGSAAVTRSSCASRTSLGTVGDEPKATRLSAVAGSTVITPGTGPRIGSPASSLRLPPVVTPASSRGYDPLTGDEPRMNGRAVLRVRGVRRCHRIARSADHPVGGMGVAGPAAQLGARRRTARRRPAGRRRGPRWRGPADRAFGGRPRGARHGGCAAHRDRAAGRAAAPAGDAEPARRPELGVDLRRRAAAAAAAGGRGRRRDLPPPLPTGVATDAAAGLPLGLHHRHRACWPCTRPPGRRPTSTTRTCSRRGPGSPPSSRRCSATPP